MIDPVKLAKDNGLWPTFPPPPSGTDLDEAAHSSWRDGVRTQIKKLISDYVAWANSEKGTIADPGLPPRPSEMPIQPPEPSASEEVHKKFRAVTDAWYDSEYLARNLPESEIWSAAAGLWQGKLSKARADQLSARRRIIGRFRFVGYIVTAVAVGILTWMSISVTALPPSSVGGICGLLAVLAVFGVDYLFNRAEDGAARAEAEESMRTEKATEEKRRDERKIVLQRLGLPDDGK